MVVVVVVVEKRHSANLIRSVILAVLCFFLCFFELIWNEFRFFLRENSAFHGDQKEIV